MKQYIMGMITGASLIACSFMFMGATDGENGRYQITDNMGDIWMVDSSNGEMYKWGSIKKAWKKRGGFEKKNREM